MNFFRALMISSFILSFALRTIAQDRQDSVLPDAVFSPVDYVNPYIGTDKSDHLTVWESKGATFPGVLLPFGMVQITPDRYMYTDKKISSFSFLNHRSGWASRGNFHIMASTSGPDTASGPKPSGFSHLTEKTTPYYYSVILDDSRIKAEFTATSRVGYCRFSFPESASSDIFLADISEARMIDKNTIEGVSGKFYFVAKFSKPFGSCSIEHQTGTSLPGTRMKPVVLGYSTSDKEFIDVRIGFSSSSYEGAARNLDTEVPSWNFQELIQINRKVWNDKLGQIEVKGGTPDQTVMFYTALYHSLFMPAVVSDADASTNSYTNLYPWDTYRSKHPLFTITDPERQGEMISSVLADFDRTGWLPTGNMMGNHNIELILDSYVKGIRNFDADKALAAMRKSVMEAPYARREMSDFVQYGYVPAEVTSSVTHSLEFAYNDWALAEFIRVTGNSQTYKNDHDTLLRRAHDYVNLYDANAGFMRAKTRNGEWADGGYCEGTEWTYSWYAPHDVRGLINLMGGRNKFSARLTECFEKGYYVHDNEPPLHYAYLFNFSGEPWKTQKWARKITEENYSNAPGGIPGNDDLGALSSWYVLSAMGFYPVTPGIPAYEIGSPVFDEVIIHLSNGRNFTIRAKNNSRKNVYIQSADMDGIAFSHPWISHDDIAGGKTLEFKMGPLPNRKWGSHPADAPLSMTHGTPAFSFSDMKLSIAKTLPDKPINLSVVVTNKGNATGTAKISIMLDGKLWKNVYEVIGAGEVRRINYPVTLYNSGSHSIAVNSLKPRLLLVEVRPAKFVYADLKMAQPALLYVNDSIAISATVKNTGGVADSTETKFYINDKETERRTIVLQPGEEKPVQFVFTGTDDGLSRIWIGDLDPLQVRVLAKGQKSTGRSLIPARLKAAMVFNFDEGPGNSVKDLSGKRNNARVRGKVKWVDGLFGKAIQTDASQQVYLEIPDNEDLDRISYGKTLTMMCWIYPMEEENFADIFSKGDFNTLQLKGGNTVINYYTGGWEGHESSASVPEKWNRSWHHLAGVTEGGYLKLYVDGHLAATKKAEPKNPKGESANANYLNQVWNIGRNCISTERVFKGYIDDVMLFETALTQQEIFNIMMHVN